MNIFNTVTDLAEARLQAGQNVKVRGLDVLLDGGNAEYYVQTLLEYGGVPPVGTDVDVTLANTNVAVKLASESFPSGGIIMWSGSIGSIPEGWSLCDGTNGTPDLRNSFVVGSEGIYSIGDTGGNSTVQFPSVTSFHTLTLEETPSHSHLTVADGTQDSSLTNSKPMSEIRDTGSQVGQDYTLTSSAGDANLAPTEAVGGGQGHQHSISTAATDSNLPPFFALAYIMRTGTIGQVLLPNRPEGLGSYLDVAGVVDLDARGGAISVFEVSPAADITELNIINAPESTTTAYGAAIKLIARSPFTVTFGPQFNWTDNTPPTLSTITSRYDYLSAFTVDQGTTFDAELSISELD